MCAQRMARQKVTEISQENIDGLITGRIGSEPVVDQGAGQGSRSDQDVGLWSVASPDHHSATAVKHALGATTPKPRHKANLERILSINVPLAVMLAQQDLPVESILDITVGTIVEFDVPFDSDLTLEVANQPIAQGLAVKVGENFGLRITQIGSVKDRIDALGGR